MKIMKNKVFYIIVLFLFVALVSCDEDETKDISRVTYYPIFEILGDNPYVLDFTNPPASYVDPGVIVTEGDVEIDYTVTDNVDLTTPGFYAVSYSATNVDGFSASSSRDVILGCPGDDDKVITVTGPAISATNYGTWTYDVTLTKAGYATWEIDDINDFFSIPIPGEVSLLCGDVVAGNAGYGMFVSASYDGSNIIFNWAYFGYNGTTTIPITYN